MSAMAWARFRDEVLSIYRSARRPTTWRIMRRALDLLGRTGIRTTRDLTPATVARFVAIAREQGLSDVTIDSYLRSVSASCTYAARMAYLRVSPFAVVKGWGLDAEPPELPAYLTLRELARLLRELDRGATDWRGRRLRALVATVAHTGLRRGEALHLKAADVDLASGFLKVARRRLGHRAKTRASVAPVPIPGPLESILAAWLPEAACEWCFPNATRTGPWTGGPRGARPNDALAEACRRAGVPRANWRMLRHSFATHAPTWGLDPIRLKQVLRHTTLRTQEVYIHPDHANLRDAVRRVHFPAPTPAPAPAT
jgi:integrase